MTNPRPGSKPKRHPVCPYCQYNLRGHFDLATMRSVRCPECGENIEASEVRWSHRRGDWTFAVGLRKASAYLLLRGAVALVILAASVVLMELFGQALSQTTAAGFIFSIWTILVVQIIFGIPAGKALSTGFEDAAGFSSLLLPILSTATLVIVAVLIVTILPSVWTLEHAPLQLMLFVACAVAALVIIVDYLREMA